MLGYLPPSNRLEKLSADRAGQSSILVNEIVLGKRRITTGSALRLSRYFGTSPQFWLGLQNDYDLDVAAGELGDTLEIELRLVEVSK